MRMKMTNDNKRKQVCLFGLSADPPTGRGGHVGIVCYLSSLDQFDEVRVLPVYSHMFDKKRGKQASFDDRVAMCQLAFENLSTKVKVSLSEKECYEQCLVRARGSHSKLNDTSIVESLRVGTADLLDMLIEDEPNSDFTLALGADTFVDLTSYKWRRSEDVLKLVEGRVLILNRKASNESNESSFSNLVEDRIQEVNERFSCNMKRSIKINIDTLSSVSSTIVRSSRDHSILAECLVPSVRDFIESKKLYAFSNNDK